MAQTSKNEVREVELRTKKITLKGNETAWSIERPQHLPYWHYKTSIEPRINLYERNSTYNSFHFITTIDLLFFIKKRNEKQKTSPYTAFTTNIPRSYCSKMKQIRTWKPYILEKKKKNKNYYCTNWGLPTVYSQG